MESKNKIVPSSLPKMLADLSHSNQFLKVFSLCLIGLCSLVILLVTVIGNKEPVVLTLTPSAGVLETTSPPKPESEIQAAVKAYIEKRYKWEPNTVVQRLQEAEAFVLPGSMKAYQAAVANIARFSTEKLVSQRVYPEKLNVNFEKRTVSITGDRITAIQGIKAAGDLRLEVSFESGPRSKVNPWGIYITKEKED